MIKKSIIRSNEVSSVEEVGGKGHHLQKLVSWKANVAPFFVISTHASHKINQEVRSEVESFIKLHGKIVFRSSMVNEDQADASFAGIFETVLGVEAQEWEEKLTRVFDSLSSPRAQAYIKQKNIVTPLKMAVVVQKEISVTKSGVLFSRSPVSPTSAIAIDAALGMGEAVVSGHADVDHYLVTRSLDIIHGAANTVLSGEELDFLVTEALRLEHIYNRPVDIEWGFLDKKLYIFQIRPITRSFSALKVLADTNLSESYPGIISPFSAHFVQKAYENVFMEAAELLGYDSEKLKNLRHYCSELITPVDDHLYYNLENYYAVLRALPGGEKNIQNWHKMIGGKGHKLHVPYRNTGLTPFENLTAAISLVKIAYKKDHLYETFLKNLKDHAHSISDELDKLKTAQQSLVYMNLLLKRPLDFGITILNDFFIMIGLGLLSWVVKRKGALENVVIDLLRTDQGLDSIKPLSAFNDLVEKLSQDFLEDFLMHPMPLGLSPYEEFFKRSIQKWPQDTLQVKDFLDTYGDRSFKELKIESLPLKNDPSLFKQLMKWGRKHHAVENKHLEKSREIELNFFEEKILNFTRSCIEFRETQRLWRGRFYHFLRQVILKLADQLIHEKACFSGLDLKDFFSLTPQEWDEYSQKKISDLDVLEIIKSRKWKTKTRSYPEIIAWSQSEALPSFSSEKSLTGILQGQGVSPGAVEAVALVLDNPMEAFNQDLENFILVTKNTDPAWVYIMSRSMGLVSEKGSLLSHTAIIGRELGIPTLVGVKSATQIIRSGDRISIDGTTGEIKIL